MSDAEKLKKYAKYAPRETEVEQLAYVNVMFSESLMDNPVFEKFWDNVLELDPGAKIAQVKWKFGEPRIYIRPSDDLDSASKELIQTLALGAEGAIQNFLEGAKK